MSYFRKSNTKIFTRPGQIVTPDTVYWKKLGPPVQLKEFGAIDYIDFSPVEPHYFAATCSAKVQIYNSLTRTVYKTLSKFQLSAYGGSFRSDGAVLCAGTEEGLVKVFVPKQKTMLRCMKGHKGAVHRTFFTCDNRQVASFSDDKVVKLWDITCSEAVSEFSLHEDYVRAGAVSPLSPNIIVSGSYDRKLRMFDSRLGVEPVFTVDHNYPVESVIFLPSGGLFISAGGNEIKVWDALAGGRLLARVCQHHKTVTCLGLASSGSRFISGSLDRHLKIYDVATYKAVHDITFTNSILSVGISANDETLAVGTVDGIISVLRRETVETVETDKPKKKSKGSLRYYSDKFTPSENVDAVVRHEGKQVQANYDACLRKFQYSKTLDIALRPYLTRKTPHVTVTVLQELIRRKGLENALNFRQDKSIIVLIKFLMRYIGDCRFTATLIDVANVLLDVYEKRENASLEVLELLKKLRKIVEEEVKVTLELVSLSGVIKLLLGASTVNDAQHFSSETPKVSSPIKENNLNGPQQHSLRRMEVS